MFTSLLLTLAIAAGDPGTALLLESRPEAAQVVQIALHRTPQFLVEAPSESLAKQVGAWAEQARGDLHRRWFGSDPPDWSRPAVIQVCRQHPGFYATVIDSDGVVTITLWAGDGHLQSTVRHEIWHAVVHLRYPDKHVPRWLDEGLAICNESPEEQRRQLAPLFGTPRRYPVAELAGMREYPPDIALFYAQSYSLADFLVRRHGEKNVIQFIEASFAQGQEAALRSELGYADFAALERDWTSSLPAAVP